MGNVLKILLRDLKRLCKAPAAMIVVGALLVLPSLYTWYNVVAFWNPYDATGNLRVCVVNQDAGTENELTGRIDVGSMMVEQLNENDQLSWVTDKDYDTAMENLRVGDVYAVYVLPEDFSACLASPLTGDVKSPRIEYYANEKLGPVSPKITDAAASTLEQTINSTFVSTVAEVATQAIDDALAKADENALAKRAEAAGYASEAKAAVGQARETLAGIAEAIDEARAKVAAGSEAMGDVSTLADDAQAVLRDVTNEATLVQASLAGVSSDSIPKVANVLAELSESTGKASSLADAIASAAGEAQTDADVAASKIQPVINVMREAESDLRAAASKVKAEALSNRLAQAAQDMAERADEAQALLDGIEAAAARADDASLAATDAARSLNRAVTRASDSLAQYSSDLHGSAATTVDSAVAQVGDVCASLSVAIGGVDTVAGQVRALLGQVDGILADCKSALAQSDALVGSVQSDLDSMMADARLLAQSDVIANLAENGRLNAENISEFMGSPTKLSTTQLYHPNAYGTAMAPLFMNLTFWIGAFMLVIIFLLEVDSEGVEDPKPWQRYLGRFLLFCIFAVVQAIICCAGTLALGVQAANVGALFVAASLSSLAFMSIIYALSATFRHVGKALCIVLVFAQIPGGSGLYPVEMTSSFFQAIYPFLPFTYGIDAMRESIGGFYGSYYVHDLFVLGLFFAGSLAFGLLLGPLMSNVVRMTARQVYEGDLYNGEDSLTPERPYRLSHVLRALTEKESYRKELEERYARFSRRYPLFIRGSIVLGVGVPVVIGFLLTLDAAEKVTLLTFLLLWLIALIAFLVFVESQRYSFERQLNLEGMSEERLLGIFRDRNRMVHASSRFEARRKATAEAAVDGASHERQGGFKNVQATSPGNRKRAGGIRNVWMIARRDVNGLFKNVMSVILTVGLVVLPSLFAWYNILACWNVFDNTSNLSIAVASKDKGYESDLMPVNVNVGEKVVSALHGNDQINWVFTNADEAVEGVKAGTYYAALVIPENFSTNMLTFYEGDSASAVIDYYVNEKKNAIAPNITGIGASTVSHEVNETFTNTLSEVAVGLTKSLSKAVEEGDVEGRVASLAEHMRDVAARLDQSADVLGLYASLGENAQDALASGADAVTSARTQLQAAASDIDSGKARLHALADELSSSMNDVEESLGRAETVVAEIQQRADGMYDDISGRAAIIASQLRSEASEIDAKAGKVSNILSVLQKLRDDLHTGAAKQLERDIELGGVDVELSAEASVMTESTVVLDKNIAALTKALEVLQSASTACTSAAGNLEDATVDIQERALALREAVTKAREDAAAMKTDLESALQPGIDQLKSDIAKFEGDLDRTGNELSALDPDLAGTMQAAAASLGEASSKVDEVDAKLKATAQKTRDLATAVESALLSGDVEKLRSLLAGNAEDLAKALTAPVQVERTALFPSENFGSSMTPLYCTLALFIGALLIMVAMKPEVSQRGREGLVDPKPRHLYFGRFCAVGLVSLMQTTLMGLGTMLFLKVQMANPLLFMMGFWLAGLVLSFMIYTLVVAFGNLGKAIAVLLLIVQVTACGGSFPLQMLPDFVQAISPWVPATYIVDALQAAMMGVYHNDFWVSMGALSLFIVPFLLLGLVLRKPMERFMRFYVRKVEECKIMG